jgi:hypothetical protein
MAFADPQSVTISTVAQSLARVSQDPQGVFLKDDGLVKLTIGQTNGKRFRRLIRLDHSKIAADPLISSQNIKYSMGVYLVFDLPLTGYTVAEAKAVSDGFIAYLSASSGAVVTKLLGGEK